MAKDYWAIKVTLLMHFLHASNVLFQLSEVCGQSSFLISSDILLCNFSMSFDRYVILFVFGKLCILLYK